jgi:hypothetical protein
MPPRIHTVPEEILIPTGVATANQRLVVGVTAGTLGSFCAGAVIPSFTGGGPGTVVQAMYPSAVTLSVEAGMVGKVRVTVDGQTPVSSVTPLGQNVPIEPNAPLRIAMPSALQANAIKIVSDTATTGVQALFEWTR